MLNGCKNFFIMFENTSEGISLSVKKFNTTHDNR